MPALLAKKQSKAVSHDYVKHWRGETEWKLELEWEHTVWIGFRKWILFVIKLRGSNKTNTPRHNVLLFQ